MRGGEGEVARLSDTYRKLRLASEPQLSPLQPRRDTWTARLVRWHAAPPKSGESVRWESIDGRWISISLGDGDDIGRAVVTSGDGGRAVVDTYEEALVVAETWRS
jgi:hypothetical protein